MKLYVGNLPPTFSDKDLQELFSNFGEIKSARIIIDHQTGKSKNFGFVEFESKESAEEAIKEMDKKVVGKGAIIVNEARPPQRKSGPFERRGGGGFEKRGPGGFEKRGGGGGNFQEKRGDRFNKRFS